MLPCPWDSADNNTGVGCHFLLQCMKVKRKVKLLSRARLLVTPRTAAYQAPLSMGFPRQVYWSGLPFPLPRDLPNPGIEPASPALQADSLPAEPPGKSSLYRVLFFMQFEVLFGLVKMDRVSTAKDRVESSAWQSSQMDEAT